MRVLLTGSGGPAAELLKLEPGHDAFYADADTARIAPGIPKGLRRFVPMATDVTDFLDRVQFILDHDEIDVMVSQVDEELPLLEHLRRKGYDILQPSQWMVVVCLDKMSCIAWLRDHGVPVPATHVEKPRRGRGSKGVNVIQEHLHGPEYSVQVVSDKKGNIQIILPMLCLEKRGVTVHGISGPQDEVTAVCEKVHEVLNATGTYNIQGMLNEDGFKVFEINPRFSSTTGMVRHYGVDPIHVWMEGATKRIYPLHRVTLRRHWANTVSG